jgi:hypothetical protein
MIRFEERRGTTLIGSGWHGQTRFYRTVDTYGLVPVSCPYNRFQIWLGRFIAQLIT